jgi:peroxiredoxin
MKYLSFFAICLFGFVGSAIAHSGEDHSHIDAELEAASVKAEALLDAGDYEGAIQVFLDEGIRLRDAYPEQIEAYYLLSAAASLGDSDTLLRVADEVEKFSIDSARMKQRALAFRNVAERVGKPIELSGVTIDGNAVDIADYRGKVLIVDFWATWCPPCVADVPNMVSLYETYHAEGLEILGISLDQKVESIRSFASQRDMPWLQICDQQAWQGELVRKFGISSIPTVWIVDKQGILRYVNGKVNREARVKALLAE